MHKIHELLQNREQEQDDAEDVKPQSEDLSDFDGVCVSRDDTNAADDRYFSVPCVAPSDQAETMAASDTIAAHFKTLEPLVLPIHQIGEPSFRPENFHSGEDY